MKIEDFVPGKWYRFDNAPGDIYYFQFEKLDDEKLYVRKYIASNGKFRTGGYFGSSKVGEGAFKLATAAEVNPLVPDEYKIKDEVNNTYSIF